MCELIQNKHFDRYYVPQILLKPPISHILKTISSQGNFSVKIYMKQFHWKIFLKRKLTITYLRGSHPEAFCKRAALKNLENSMKNISAGVSFQQITLKKRLQLWCFPVNFVKNCRAVFLQNTSGRLLENLLNLRINWNKT